ncbi:energy transducer TonB [Algoriphagus namhaensis]
MKTNSMIKYPFYSILVALLFVLFTQNTQAQSTETIYEEVDQMPQYPGGMEGLTKYMVKNLKYPESAKSKSIQGTVMVTFVVQKDGTVSQAELLRGIGAGCDEEALRIVNGMEPWTAGVKDGEKVNTRLVLPIKFAL